MAHLWCDYLLRKSDKREINKREYEKRKINDKYNRFNVVLNIRES